MARFRCTFLAALLAGGSTQCLLYTDPINVKPAVTINESPATITRNQKAVFTASASDPDQDATTLSLAWFQRDGAGCPKSVAEAAADHRSVHVGDGVEMEVPPHAAVGPFCIWVIATDRDGATAFAARATTVVNQAPLAVLEVMAPPEAKGAVASASAALFSELRLSGAGSTDPDDDALTFAWHGTRPDGSDAQPETCTTAADAARTSCYVLRTPGVYHFELEVKDDTDAAGSALAVTVRPDAPPCVVRTMPPFLLPAYPQNSEQRLVFRVLEVTDDGDPFPAPAGYVSQSTFNWYTRKFPAKTFVRWPMQQLATFALEANTSSPGDIVEVRLQYGDRVKDRELGCDRNALSCPVAVENKCHQWVGWTVVY